MNTRAVISESATRLSPADEAAERSAILQRLHAFANATGAAPGDDVVRYFDSCLRRAVERGDAPA